MKKVLIDPFLDGDYFFGVLIWILFLLCISFVLFVFSVIEKECEWSRVPAISVKAKLVSISNTDSTLQVMPVVASSGEATSFRIAVAGHDASVTTVWDCGSLGRLKTENEEVFRFAKQESILFIKQLGREARIVGIER